MVTDDFQALGKVLQIGRLCFPEIRLRTCEQIICKCRWIDFECIIGFNRARLKRALPLSMPRMPISNFARKVDLARFIPLLGFPALPCCVILPKDLRIAPTVGVPQFGLPMLPMFAKCALQKSNLARRKCNGARWKCNGRNFCKSARNFCKTARWFCKSDPNKSKRLPIITKVLPIFAKKLPNEANDGNMYFLDYMFLSNSINVYITLLRDVTPPLERNRVLIKGC